MKPSLHTSILKPGRNSWRVAHATRASVLVDACEYYTRLDQALRRARHSIDIVGWDFDGRIKLRPDVEGSPSLGEFLRERVEAEPDLHVRILVWSTAVVHAPGASAALLIGASWEDHARITVRLDSEHALYASHHQKIVVVDDEIAFCGGIDLTVQRWDTCGHDECNSVRCDPTGAVYCPVHDVQMAVEGDAARALGAVARDRWRRASGETPPAPPPVEPGSLWPASLAPEFRDIPVGISRTMPARRREPRIEEIAALTADMFRAARQSIYIEAQYFCGRDLRRGLKPLLGREDGPEVFVVIRKCGEGLVERWVMEENRDRTIRYLRKFDRFNRLRVLYPAVKGQQGPCEVNVHAKVVIVDDEILRVGSANFNNRSMGVDSECDLVIQAKDDGDRRSIAAIRARLLAEHLGAQPDEVEAAVEQHGLLGAVDRLNGTDRGLRPLPDFKERGPLRSVFATWLLDPRRRIGWPLRWRKGRRRARAQRSFAKGPAS